MNKKWKSTASVRSWPATILTDSSRARQPGGSGHITGPDRRTGRPDPQLTMTNGGNRAVELGRIDRSIELAPLGSRCSQARESTSRARGPNNHAIVRRDNVRSSKIDLHCRDQAIRRIRNNRGFISFILKTQGLYRVDQNGRALSRLHFWHLRRLATCVALHPVDSGRVHATNASRAVGSAKESYW